jgi:phosphatidylserine decarboxylase
MPDGRTETAFRLPRLSRACSYNLAHFFSLESSVSDRFSVLHQYLLPKQALTVFAGWMASSKGRVAPHLIRWFVGRYGVNMEEALNPDLASYTSFNEFFTRALSEGARPLADADFICPVDGAISQFGEIEHDQIFQAKGHRYSTTALLGGDRTLAAQFEHGSFATLYLSPRDYHRIHMPCDGRLTRMIYVPGSLFSVNPSSARGVLEFNPEWTATRSIRMGEAMGLSPQGSGT